MIKWILAVIGFAITGSLTGAAIGFLIGLFAELFIWGTNRYQGATQSTANNSFRQTDARTMFLQSFLILAAHVIQADGRIMHSEMEFVRSFLRQNFGESAVNPGNDILLRQFNFRKQHGDAAWMQELRNSCTTIRISMPEEHRLQLIAFLAAIAKADGNVDQTELNAIREIARMIGVAESVVDQMFSLGGTSLDDAYRVLGVTPDATDAEVKAAFRRLTLQYHPDRVAALGDDVRRAAEQRFKEINEAKEKVYAARGM